jgi:hypothetical protein
MSLRLRLSVMLVALVLAPSVLAQDEPDFEGEAYDDALDKASESGSAWRPFYEALLRGDRVSGLPAGRADLERVRSRLRAGTIWSPQGRDEWRVGIAVEGAIGTGANKDSLINNDIEDVDGAGLDQWWVSRRFGSAGGGEGEVQFGKSPLPLELSPLLWDGDLRPVGASLRWGGSARDFDRWSLVVGAFEPDPLDERGARLSAAQFGWHWRPGAPTSAGVLLGYLDWSDLDEFARVGLGRGNSLSVGRYRNDYRLLDAQVYVRHQLGEKWLEVRLDRVTNLDADVDDDGTRASLVYGDRFDPNQLGWEFGWSWQRQQRDAVLAAVTADDWWFHTAARGHMPWVGYGFNATWSVRVAAFFETRDGLGDQTERLLLDLDARW